MKKTHPIYNARILKALEKLHKKLPKKTEPLIRGSLVTMVRVCGGKHCRCLRGYKHRSLYLSQSSKGKLKMIYIPKEAEEAAKEGVFNYRKLKKLLNRLSQIHILRLKRKIFP
jgi:hypothetical protein